MFGPHVFVKPNGTWLVSLPTCRGAADSQGSPTIREAAQRNVINVNGINLSMATVGMGKNEKKVDLTGIAWLKSMKNGEK